MKRYLLIGGWKEIQMKDEITREDLVAVKTRDLDWLIDTREGKFFDAENNQWKDINDQ